jgi:hypothetical protein
MIFYLLCHSRAFLAAQVASIRLHHPGSPIVVVRPHNATEHFHDFPVVPSASGRSPLMLRSVIQSLPNEPSAWKVQMHAAEKVTGPKSLDNPDFNGSFEQPACDEGTFATRIVGWTGSTNEHAFGVTREVVLPPIPDGRQVAFVNNFPTESGIPTKHAIATQLSDRLEANNAYKLSTYFGWRNDILESIGILELYVGGRPVDGEIEGGQLLASTWVDLKRGEFVLGSVKYVATAENAHLGEKLGIRLMGTPTANYFSQTNFDHVTLTITMPIEESADATSPANR